MPQAPLVPAQGGLRELPQPAAEAVALCPHRDAEHVPHLRMIEEQIGVDEQGPLLAGEQAPLLADEQPGSLVDEQGS